MKKRKTDIMKYFQLRPCVLEFGKVSSKQT